MSRKVNRNVRGILFLGLLVMICGCDDKFREEPGFLEGKITIGPICPVETDPPVADCLPTLETYKAYQVSVWTADLKRKITLLEPSLDGLFTTELQPGNYVVIFDNSLSGIGGSNLPVEVIINPGDITILNIDIDTGIR